MKTSITLLAIAGAALTLVGCDEPYQDQADIVPPPMEESVAPSATDQTAPAADTAVPDDAAVIPPLPAEEKTSEQSVQPESETLFY
jgi:hypothetical protein